MHIREQLLAHSDAERSYTYNFQKTPFDVDNYFATIRVTPVTDGDRASSSGGRRSTATATRSAHWDGLLRHEVFQGGFDALKAHFAGDVTARREYRVEGLAEPFSHYTDAVRAGDLLFISGCVSVDADGSVVGDGDVVAQARQVFANIALVLTPPAAAPSPTSSR